MGARTETKVNNRKDHDPEENFVDPFRVEIFFIPVGRFDEIMKSVERGSFGQDFI
jgi:hypothetical protein